MNARVAGGFPLSEAAGADLVGQMLNGLFGRPVDHGRLGYKPGICGHGCHADGACKWYAIWYRY